MRTKPYVLLLLFLRAGSQFPTGAVMDLQDSNDNAKTAAIDLGCVP